MASWKLRHYFLANPIMVVSHASLSYIIKNKDTTGRMAKMGDRILAIRDLLQTVLSGQVPGNCGFSFQVDLSLVGPQEH